MIITMHSISTMHCNLATEIRIAAETGYDGIEFVASKLLRYLNEGFTTDDLNALLQKHNIRPMCINALAHVEQKGQAFQRVLTECERLCAAADAIGCPVIQIVPLDSLKHLSLEESFEMTASNVEQIARIGERHHVHFQLEVIAWAPIRSLSQGLALIERVGRPNIGMVIDFWHLWAGENTTPDEVAKLNQSTILGVHFCDGKPIPKDGPWAEGALRGCLPGEGDIPLKDWVDATKATGFDGTWSSELLSPKHWEWDLWEVARETKRLMVQYAG